MEFKPYPYQRYCIDRIKAQPAVALWLDMGLGKTIITLTAIVELGLRHVLIVAPKKVAESTWQTEAARWEHTRGLTISTVLGNIRQREAALSVDADIYVIGRDTLAWLASTGRRYPCIVLDESSSYKNHQSRRFKAVKLMLPGCLRLIELTGTPAPQGLIDLWAQVYLLDGGRRLGRTITQYRDIFFQPDRRCGAQVYTYKPRRGAEDQIKRLLSDLCVSMRAEDYIQLPDIVEDNIPVALSPDAWARYKQLEKEAVLEVEGEEVTAQSAAALAGKLLQLSGGAVYDDVGAVRMVHADKLDALCELCEQLGGAHAIIVYAYRHEVDRILARVPGAVLYECAEQLAAWNAGKIQYLLVHPASCGYGLNLQQGGHHIIWYSLTWALELYQQTNARLHRRGQMDPVIVHRLLVDRTMDGRVANVLASKDQTQEAILQGLRAHIAEVI